MALAGLERGETVSRALITVGVNGLCFCEERGFESLLESIGLAKVIELVGVLFSKNSVLDEDKYDFPDMMAFFDAPVIKDGGAHRPVFLQNVVAEPKEKFMSANVTFFVVRYLGKAVDRKIESFSDKKVGSGFKALFFFDD